MIKSSRDSGQAREDHSSHNSARDLFALEGRVAVITGGAGLLARSFAKALLEFGATVVLADVNEAVCADRAIGLSNETGKTVTGLRCDVAEMNSWIALADQVRKRFERIDILVNNAAVTNSSRSRRYSASFEDYPVEDWKAILDVNLTGVFLGCQVVGSQMLAQGKGSIINIGSLYGMVSPSHRIYEGTGVCQPAAYSVSKAGVLALTRYLGSLWAERGVRVNAVSPGGVFNEHKEPFLSRYGQLSPMKRMARPSEMCGALVYLASDASSYCTAQNYPVDGGWTAW